MSQIQREQLKVARERAVLVSVRLPRDEVDLETRVGELSALARTADAEVVEVPILSYIPGSDVVDHSRAPPPPMRHAPAPPRRAGIPTRARLALQTLTSTWQSYRNSWASTRALLT